jgi:hypothetical protein
MCFEEFTTDNDQAIFFWISAPCRMVKWHRYFEKLFPFIIRTAKLLPGGDEASEKRNE